MKLIRLKPRSLEYFLNPTELQLLKSLLRRFPFTEENSGHISRTRKDARAVEQQKLLDESLQEHRQELKAAARTLVTSKNLKPCDRGHLLTLGFAKRETLLQILNDIRIGCWRLLGEPENLDTPAPEFSEREFAWCNLMHLAGYFEHSLIAQDDPET